MAMANKLSLCYTGRYKQFNVALYGQSHYKYVVYIACDWSQLSRTYARWRAVLSHPL